MKKAFLFPLIAGLLCIAVSGCSAQTKTLDYGPKTTNFIVEPISFEDAMKNSDVLIVGKCTAVNPAVPSAGYTEYRFDVKEVLGGELAEKSIFFSVPRSEITGFGEIGKDEYVTGKEYLLPLKKETVMFQSIYPLTVYGISLNLTDEAYRYYEQIDVPKGMTVKSYAVSQFNAAEHETPAPEKDYPDDFTAFLEESAYIAKVRVVSTEQEQFFTRAFVECQEVYKGQRPKSLRKDGLISIAVMNGTVEDGKEYVVGFVGGGAYEVSTRHSVYDVSEEIISKCKGADT